MLALTLGGAWRLGPRVWQHIEPAHGQPFLPPWPWQQPRISPAASAAFVSALSPGWRATNLGNPAASHYSACWQSLPRTPWDLALSDGSLYVGLGNASNSGPSANAGPVPLLAYNLNDQRWQQHATLPEEEIQRFVKQGTDLWIPGADPRGSWRWGNLYRQNNVDGSWWQERRLPQFIHVHDLAWHRKQLVVAGNVPDAVNTGPKHHRHGSALAHSGDGGKTWSVHRLQGWRATALLPLQDQLYAVQVLSGDSENWSGGATKIGPPDGLLMGGFRRSLDRCFIGWCRVVVVVGLQHPRHWIRVFPQASSLDGGGFWPALSCEEGPPACGRMRPLRRFSLSL